MIQGDFGVSFSGLNLFMDCPRRWFYEKRCPGIPKRTDYARLCGVAVHQHIKKLYDPPAGPRPFFYHELQSAVGAWSNRWTRAVAEAKARNMLLFVNEAKEAEYLKIGIICLSQYWNRHVDKPRPLEIELRRELNLGGGIRLIGVFDQLRPVSFDWIRRHRPELVQDGKLIDGYAPVVIFDLKTDYLDFDPARLGDGQPTLAEQVRNQYYLHEYLQPTMYTYLYERIYGKKPVGFIWYHLRSGKAYPTYRGESDYLNLFASVNYYRENVVAQFFQKVPGRRCSTCDHLLPCNEDRHFKVVKPEEFGEEGELPLVVPTPVEKESWRQPRLSPYKIRRGAPLPVVPSIPAVPRLVLSDLPWDEEDPLRLLVLLSESEEERL